MSQENVNIVRGIYDAYSRHDEDAFFAVLDPNVEWVFADNFFYADVNPAVGRDAFTKGRLRRLETDWDGGFEGVPDEILDAGENVVGLGHYVGVHKATGKRLRAQFAHIFTLANGKVTRWRQYLDTKQLADVAGVDSAAIQMAETT
jgi:ketosteroid isomerase-like protein